MELVDQLKHLQKQFEEAARLFPGLTSVSEAWPEESGKFRVSKEYQYNPKNLVKLWEHNGIHKTEGLVIARRHWLIKPKGEKWSKESAYRRLRLLADDGVELPRFVYSRYKEYLEKEKLTFDIEMAFRTPVFLEGEEFYNDMSCAAEWVLMLYGHAEDTNPFSRRRSTRHSNFDSWVEDIFIISAKYCQQLISNVEKLSDTGQEKKNNGGGTQSQNNPPGRPISDEKKKIVKKICGFIENHAKEIPNNKQWAFLVDKFNWPYSGKRARRGESLKAYLKSNHSKAYKALQ